MQSHYKIIHTTCHTGWGGLEKRIFNESVWMDKQGHQIVIAAPENTPLFLRAKKHGFRVYPVPFTRMGLIRDYKKMVAILASEQPDILNTHGNIDAKSALPAANKTRIPCRILSRHISAHIKNSWYNRRLYRHLSHYIFTTADYTTRHLQTVFHLKNTRVLTVSSGIQTPDTLIPKDTARKNLAAELGCAPDTRFAGFVGRLSQDKGVSTLLRAFSLIRHRIPHHLVLAGTGTDEYRSRLMDLARQLGIEKQTHFIGFKEDVWPVYRALDCKVLASKNINGIPYEGIPQALLEAMYCSCPVIGSKTGGIPDIVRHGITGLLFDPGETSALAEQIMETLTQEAATLERVYTARENVHKAHTIDAMGKNILRIYRLHQIKQANQYPSGWHD
jgi:glycosyltransferase involved in cell wall biosynthesis